MSWSVEGRVYESYVEYQKALARQQEARLRRQVERLQVPAADTSGLASEVAAARARQHGVKRLSTQLRSQAAERRGAATIQRQEVSRAFSEIERSEELLLRDLEVLGGQIEEKIDRLEERRRAEGAATAAALEQELAADRRDVVRAGRRRERLIAEAEQILAAWSASRLGSLGVDRAGIEGLLDRARRASAVEGLELARRAHDQAQAMAAEATFREAKLLNLRAVYRAEVEDLRTALEFSPVERRDLVGEGAAALDAPLLHEIDRLGERIESVTAYEDHEDRLGRIGQAIDAVSLRVSDLAAQIRDFDRLEAARVDLVRNRLEEKLAVALGEKVEIDSVEPGALGLQPVDVRMRTGGGEKIDCSAAIDGTLRIHHYDHLDQASCARSARKLAESLPELMAMREEPRLDIAAGTAAPTDRPTTDARATQAARRPVD